MVTRITRTILFLQLVAAIAFAAGFRTLYGTGIGLSAMVGIGIIVLFRFMITTNNFFLSWLYRSETPSGYRIAWHQAFLVLLAEFRSTMLTSSWTMPFRAFEGHVAPVPAGLPVLLVHGYGCNSGYWRSMSRALKEADITHRAIDMEPVFAGIDDFVPSLRESIEAFCMQTGQEKLTIVAHSMGGLAVRAYLRTYGSARIARVITLGTPHRGTGLARFGRGLNCQQMRWTGSGEDGVSSLWLRRLAAAETEETCRLFVSIYSHHDNIIAPQTSSSLPGARNIEYRGIGHVSLALHPAIQARVVDEIRSVSLPPAASAGPNERAINE